MTLASFNRREVAVAVRKDSGKIGWVIDGCRVLAVVPARGGSKGIPLKNLKKIKGRSLIEWAADALKGVEEIDLSVVSSDHPDILAEGKRCGLAAYRRSDALSGDRIGDIEVLSQVLGEAEQNEGKTFDIVLMIQPTSPSRTPTHIRQSLRLLLDEHYDSVWSLSPTDSKAHPLKQLTVDEQRIDYYDEAGTKIVARQQLSTLYHRNGIVYAIRSDCMRDYGNIMGKRCGALIIEGPTVNIDTPLDLKWGEFLADEGWLPLPE